MRFLLALIFLLTPLLALLAAGIVALVHRGQARWTVVLALVAASTLAWLAFVGLYQHETPCAGRATRDALCPTIYGYDAVLPDGHFAGILLLLASFAVPAALAGWRRLAAPPTIGASLALGPTLLAVWSAPRGDNDGLWTLIFFLLPALGGLAAVVAGVAGRMAVARARSAGRPETGELTTASPGDRLAALAIDVAVVGAVLVVPLTALSHLKYEVVAAALGITLATLYLAIPLASKGRTVGQSLVGLFVFDSRTNQPLSLVRALLRSLVIALEVTGVPTIILALPAVAEMVSLGRSGQTFTDRIFRSVVLSGRNE